MKVFVALWSRRVYQETWKWDDWSRWFFLECATLHARMRIPWEIRAQGGGFHSIFIAPEYYFSAQRKADTDSRAIDKDAKDAILVRLRAMSHYHQGTILVPGTVSYRKPLTPERAQKAILSLRAPNPGKSFQGSELDTVKHGKAIDKWQAKVETLKGFVTVGGAPRAVDIVTNKTYVFLNGDKIFTYSKKTDVYEALGPDSGVFVPGKESKSCSTKIRDVPFAFEICGDHEMGVLGAQSRKAVFTRPKIHVICSAYVETKPENSPVTEGGFVIHASSERRITTVLVREGSAFKTDGSALIVKHPFNDTVNGDPIDYWTIDLG